MRTAFGLTFLLAALAAAADPPLPAERLRAIQDTVAAAENKYFAAVEALGDSPADEKKAGEMWKAFDALQNDGFEAALALAKAEPKSPAAFDALKWIVSTPRSYYKPVGKPAIELLTERYAADPGIATTVAVLGAVPPRDTEPTHRPAVALLKAVAAKNPDKTARGQAHFGLAYLAMCDFAEAEYLTSQTTDDLAAKAEALFEAIVRDYGGCEDLRARASKVKTPTLGDRANGYLNELRNLRVGKVAPEIVGEDLDGVPLKLGDSRGRVTLLVFWASWCGPCMADVPHEKELVERFKGRPFVLVGVNGDTKLDAARKAAEKAGIPWRSFRNAESESRGPIPVAYNVRSWPTVYVLDHAGVIRHKDLRGKALDEPLEKLVQAAEAAKKGK